MRAIVATAMLCVLAILSVVGQFRMPLNGDSAYVLDVARRVLNGAVLYRDIMDVNPPFVFWASLPVAAIGGDGPGAMLAFRFAVIAVTTVCVALAWPVTRGDWISRAGFVLFALVLPIGYFGQREHLMFALTFPYLTLAAGRAMGDGSPGARTAIAAGGLAAAGIALKPTALIVVALLLLHQCIRARSLRPMRKAEHLALAGGVLLAVAAVAAWAPGYFAVVRDVAGPYAEFNREPLAALLARDVHMWSAWLAIGLGVAFAGRLAATGRIWVDLLVIAGFLASAVAQGKGFGYHYFPVVGWAGIVLLTLVFGEGRAGNRVPVLGRVLAVVALLPIVYLFGAVTWRRANGVYTKSRHEQAVVDRLVGAVPVDIAILSARIADAYPLVPERGHRVVLGFPQFWVAALPVDRPGTAAIRRRYGQDIERGRPDVIVVRNPAPAERHTGDLAVDYLAYLCHDAVARRALSTYRLADRAGGFDLYRLDANGPQACASS